MVTLREYHPGDFARLHDIDRICFVEGIAYSEREMHHFLDRPSAVRIVADRAGAIQGFIIADRFRLRRSPAYLGKIITIDVLPDARRTGVGSRLLTAAEQKLKESGCSHVSLETAIDNATAMRFYKRHGYTGLKILPNYYLGSVDALLMGKKL